LEDETFGRRKKLILLFGYCNLVIGDYLDIGLPAAGRGLVIVI